VCVSEDECAYMCVCVCERERERQEGSVCEFVRACA